MDALRSRKWQLPKEKDVNSFNEPVTSCSSSISLKRLKFSSKSFGSLKTFASKHFFKLVDELSPQMERMARILDLESNDTLTDRLTEGQGQIRIDGRTGMSPWSFSMTLSMVLKKIWFTSLLLEWLECLYLGCHELLDAVRRLEEKQGQSDNPKERVNNSSEVVHTSWMSLEWRLSSRFYGKCELMRPLTPLITVCFQECLFSVQVRYWYFA